MSAATWRIVSSAAALLTATALCAGPAPAQIQPGQNSPVTSLLVRVTSAPTDPTVRGILAATDARGQAIPDISTRNLKATLDGQPISLWLAADRPSLAVAVGVLVDSSAQPAVRTALGAALASGLQEIDVSRDTVAIVSTSERLRWDRASFTTSADELRRSLDAFAQNPPQDDLVLLDQVAGLERALAAQTQELKVLLLITNRTPASSATPAASMAVLRGMALDDHVQISMLVLPQVGGQGVAEALAEATPGGGVQYVLNATNEADLTQRVSALLAPAVAARAFSLPVLNEGSHALTVTAAAARAQTTFTVTARPVGIAAIEANGVALRSGAQIAQPLWLTVRTSEPVALDSVEWSVDGRAWQTSVEPFALLVDPEQLGEGIHEITARAIAQGRAGPSATTPVYIPFDAARLARWWLRDWGLPMVGLLASGLIAVGLIRWLVSRRARGDKVSAGPPRNEFPPALRLMPRPGAVIAPKVIEFPARGKLRIGYHPPFIDHQVGTPEFEGLAYQDIRGDDELVKDLSRHVACIWRDPETNDCFIQLGWPGPGVPVRPRPQTQVLHFGKPQDATNAAYRLFHQDVIRLSTRVEYVFNQLALRDTATPERTKVEAFESDQEGSLSA